MSPDRVKHLTDYRKERLREFYRRNPADWKDFRTHFDKTVDAGMRRHRSLIGIHKLHPDDLADDRERLDRLGLTTYSAVSIPFAPPRPERARTGSNGGGIFNIIQESGGPLRSIVFIRFDPEADLEDEYLRSAVAVAALHHELGHVDDFEKERHLRTDAPVNEIEIEAYAHRYALKRLMAGKYRYEAKLYVDFLTQQLAHHDDDAARTAARRVINEGSFAGYLEYTALLFRAMEQELPKVSDYPEV